MAESTIMRALQYDAYGPVERLALREVPSPRPAAGPLVRVTAAALNPKDALFRKGKFKVLSGWRFPKYCGVDFAGVVEAPYGDLRAGDAVFGALSELRYGRGTLAELVAPRAAEVARTPAGVAEVDAAAVALVGLTALQALRDVARVRRGASVLINGASGGVGTVAVQIARILGARVTTVSSASTVALCRSLGADEPLDYTRLDEVLGGARFDMVFDVFGNLRFARAREGLRRRGVFVSTVLTPRRLVRELVTRFSLQQERLIVVKPNRADLTQLGAWLADGQLRAVIDSRFALSDYAAAFHKLESKHTHGKIVIDVDARASVPPSATK
ncbi:MAG TPA: NAD(P)-dependent alcohol dehydrogenase [Pseudolabrys sp.]|nr:NAD(P)-dependent alcohol dehydrogenase [Pseudolabrys sp.]